MEEAVQSASPAAQAGHCVHYERTEDGVVVTDRESGETQRAEKVLDEAPLPHLLQSPGH